MPETEEEEKKKAIKPTVVATITIDSERGEESYDIIIDKPAHARKFVDLMVKDLQGKGISAKAVRK